MIACTIHQRGTALVRRMCLAPGESTPWHVDPFHRVSVVLAGDLLAIEYRNGNPGMQVQVRPGMVVSEEPTGEVHRAVNVGAQSYEEITVFLLDDRDADPQPEVE
jgi:quercetin dioxygenase-like cupin family protein